MLADVGQAVRALMDEDVSAERAAGLLGVDLAEVRRLAKVAAVSEPATAPGDKRSGKPAPAGGEGSKATVTPLPDQGAGEGAARRAG